MFASEVAVSHPFAIVILIIRLIAQAAFIARRLTKFAISQDAADHTGD